MVITAFTNLHPTDPDIRNILRVHRKYALIIVACHMPHSCPQTWYASVNFIERVLMAGGCQIGRQVGQEKSEFFLLSVFFS